jgi:hypothetical protein
MEVQVFALRVPLSSSAADHGGDRLVIRRQPAGRGVHHGLGVGRNGAVLAQVGGEHLHDRPVQLGRVAGDLLQRVDAADADIELLRPVLAELIDGLGEALGGLAPALQLEHGAILATGLAQVQGGDDGAEQDRQPAQALEDGGAQILDGLQPVGSAEATGIDRQLRDVDDHEEQDGEEYERAHDAGQHSPARDGRPSPRNPQQASHAPPTVLSAPGASQPIEQMYDRRRGT